MTEITDEDGTFIVRVARDVVDKYVLDSKVPEIAGELPTIFHEKRGVFVTLNKKEGSGMQLRGCKGIPTPELPLKEALVRSSVSAVSEDPRFPPVRQEELDKILTEVSVLTEPEEIQVKSPLEYVKRIKVGVDGLIVSWSRGAGLLLPQVPVEFQWDNQEFLSQACMKAGTTPDFWLMSKVKIFKFQAAIFEEERPRGSILRKRLI